MPLFSETQAPKRVDYPIFKPPNPPQHSEFVCEYPELPDYEFCSKHSDRGCWLRPKDPYSGLPTYNISTDYESIYPKGITRRYTLDVTDGTLFADGCENNQVKFFNASYPGPWIEACWGDDVEVTVRNHLPCNGTSIHWHGIRMLGNVENDGVNAVTQCPIAPGDSYTYKFSTTQYGTTWYHSHYSLQYSDGMAGPLTIHGPSSGNYDTSKDPLLMTDWNQRSAFEDWAWTLDNITEGRRPRMTSILLNGTGIAPPGTCANPKPSKLHTLSFQKGVRYLLRLINTSVDTTFIFSIDGHKLRVVEMDFVPIKPYTTDSVLIGIGQRYHVIVEAAPFKTTPDENYWIRTVPAQGCGVFKWRYTVENATTGIVRYGSSDANPSSQPNTFPTECSDEPYASLIPKLPWTVQNPAICNHTAEDLLVNLTQTKNPPYYPDGLPRWELHKAPLWLNFGAPTILNVAEDPSNFSAELSVKTTLSDKDQWVELLITADPNADFAAHPIHLHGHDFALLAQSKADEPYDKETAIIKRDNPPRRDVALLQRGGYLVIAFKADNPGVWLMHCHIAWHASSGLAMQILENTDQIKLHDPAAMQQTCKNWKVWYDNYRLPRCKWGKSPFQDDSGI
ncbi:multicopper oxidase [Zopfia rhizophila CBS 207.26]|uniref:Multicopper oxidase n=1 Tax=Zopfia rhizophila CBS 207.26 TaxID=1314779 RepID=A0A6A6ECY9_9PEZI|nr:multicopper oxidase [Zopfia rhizophila CBS 207.26]